MLEKPGVWRGEMSFKEDLKQLLSRAKLSDEESSLDNTTHRSTHDTPVKGMFEALLGAVPDKQLID